MNHIEIIYDKINLVNYHNSICYFSGDINHYSSDICVIASGTKAKENVLFNNHKEFIGKYLYYEIYSILNETNKDIIIIGSGDAAFDYALNLSVNNNVTLVNKSNKTKCLDLLKKRVQNNPKIKCIENTYITDLKKDNKIILNCILD